MFVRTMEPWETLINISAIDCFELRMHTNDKNGQLRHIIVVHFRYFIAGPFTQPEPENLNLNNTL